jgi:hypothetical protein
VPELAAHELRLKVGCPVLLSNGLCNGTRLRVHRLGRNVITCTSLGSTHHGNMVVLPAFPWPAAVVSSKAWSCSVGSSQYVSPLLNKTQGQSSDRIGLILQREVFSHGQLYVACSRVTSPERITMVLRDTAAARVDKGAKHCLS